MAEQGVFETRLRAALARYVADGPTDFDALEFARAVAAAEPRRHDRLGALRWPTIMVPRIAWLLLATALLLVALMASALFLGSRPAPDLSSWQRIVLPVPAGSGTFGRLTDVAASEDGYLAVGDGGSVGGLVWTSRDGLDWALVPTGDMFVGADIRAVVATGEGYVAVGGKSFMGMSEAAAWRSVDGRTWREVTTSEWASRSVDGGTWREVTTSIEDYGKATIDDVAFAGGRYVAVGSQLGAGDSVAPRIWLSDDAENWRPAGDFTLEPSYLGVMTSVAAGGPGFVAVGPDPGIWVSADGDVWTPSAPARDDPAPGFWPYGWVVAGPGGQVVVAGYSAVHASDDGARWTTSELPRSAGASLSEDTQVDKHVYDYNVTGLTATGWGYAATVRRYAAIGEGTWSTWSDWPADQTLLWTSRDGTTWVLRGPGIDPFAPSSAVYPLVLACGDTLIISAANDTWALPDGASGTTAP